MTSRPGRTRAPGLFSANIVAQYEAQTILQLQGKGFFVDHCERRIARNVKKDLFGIADLIAYRGVEVVLVQVTGGGNGAKRIAKVCEAEHTPSWLACPHRRIQVWDWRTLKRDENPTPKITEITRCMLKETAA